MKTEMVKYSAMKEASQAVAALFSGAYGTANGGSRAGTVSRSGGMFSGEKISLEALAESYEQEKQTWSRTLSGTLALLEKATIMVEQAEQRIVEQEDRIALLEDVVTTDELTALKNRRGFLEAFVAEIDRCNRTISNGGLLVLIDLDNFKSTNDTYGHLAGDACLRLVGRTLQNEIRVMDVAARLGGDEFVLLLSNTTKCEAVRRAQEIAVRLNNLAVAWYGEEIPVQASLGLRAFGAGDDPDKIFNDADTKLYANKKQNKKSCRKTA